MRSRVVATWVTLGIIVGLVVTPTNSGNELWPLVGALAGVVVAIGLSLRLEARNR